MPTKSEPKSKKENKINKINRSLIFFNIIEFALIAVIVVLFYLNISLYSTKVIFIPKGSTSAIISYLNKSGFELNSIDKTVIRFLGYPQQGWIDLKQTKLKKADFLYKLVTSKAALKTVTLIPGETAYFFIKEIAKNLQLSEQKLFNAYEKFAYKKDGNILAETYSLPIGMSEENVIYYLLNYTNRRYEEFSVKIFGEYNRANWYYYIAIASVIQKEAASVEEMPLVSSVVYNRLQKGMPLQMDGTLNYWQFSHDKITAQKIRNDKSYYNTYVHKGIPQHPVCAVSLDAIKAAIFPAKTNYLYFVRNKKTQTHLFSSTYKEHVNHINTQKRIQNVTNPPKVVQQQAIQKQNAPLQQQPMSIKELWKKAVPAK
jgi:UPF0755 protein